MLNQLRRLGVLIALAGCAGIPSRLPPAPQPVAGAACGFVMADSSNIFTQDGVDQPAALVHTGPIEYPEGFRGFRAQVRFLFVIDTTGHIIPKSITLVATTSQAFVPSAKGDLLGSLFRAARRENRPVPVCVQQDITYK